MDRRNQISIVSRLTKEDIQSICHEYHGFASFAMETKFVDDTNNYVHPQKGGFGCGSCWCPHPCQKVEKPPETPILKMEVSHG